MAPERNWIGGLIGRWLLRSTKSRFRRVAWVPPETRPAGPVLFAANHHGWHDGHVMYCVLRHWGMFSTAWVEEFEAFPLFRHVGGLPYPCDDGSVRAATMRQTVRRLRAGETAAIFPEGVLHRPPDVYPFARSMDFLARQVSGLEVRPVAIHYEYALHERPEAWLWIGEPVEERPVTEPLRQAVVDGLAALREREADSLETLFPGTLDVNERWDARARFGRKGGR